MTENKGNKGTNLNKIAFEDVIDVDEMQQLQDNWAKATDLAFITVDCNGNPITEYSNFTPFCDRMRNNKDFREKCFFCDACGGRKALRSSGPHVYICHAGLIDFAIPINIKGQHVANILSGQVATEDFEDLKPIMPQDREWMKTPENAKLWEEVPVASVEKIRAVAQIIYDSFNYTIEKEYASKIDAELREKDIKLIKEEKLRIEMEKSLRDIELKALHYQISPHFLFNVLNTIGRLAFFENAKMTEDVVYAFADMMRYILRKSSDPLSPLGDEITHVLNYLKIQKIRLGSRLQYNINIPEKYYAVRLPILAVTTIAENSIKHAVENKTSGGIIDISCEEKDGDLYLYIEDNGDGIPKSKILSILRGEDYQNNKNGAVGIYNVNTRLIQYFGPEYALIIESDNQPSMGTKVTIKIPLKSDNKIDRN